MLAFCDILAYFMVRHSAGVGFTLPECEWERLPDAYTLVWLNIFLLKMMSSCENALFLVPLCDFKNQKMTIWVKKVKTIQ